MMASLCGIIIVMNTNHKNIPIHIVKHAVSTDFRGP